LKQASRTYDKILKGRYNLGKPDKAKSMILKRALNKQAVVVLNGQPAKERVNYWASFITIKNPRGFFWLSDS
jgi:hypothetical protein